MQTKLILNNMYLEINENKKFNYYFNNFECICSDNNFFIIHIIFFFDESLIKNVSVKGLTKKNSEFSLIE